MISVNQPITESVMRENMCRAVADVFKTMINRTAGFVKAGIQSAGQPLSPVDVTAKGTPPHVVGMVGFTGDINGLIYLYFDLDFARQCTCELLDMSGMELDQAGDDVVNDAIGELTNMIVGSFKNRLCDAGHPCKLTIPSILRGSNFCVAPTGPTERQISHFDCAGHRVVTDIFLQAGE